MSQDEKKLPEVEISEGKQGIYDMLEKIGVSQAQIESVRTSMKDANIDEALEKARTYVNEQLSKARDYAKKNPGVVLGGLAGLVVGAGLLAAAIRKSKD